MDVHDTQKSIFYLKTSLWEIVNNKFPIKINLKIMNPTFKQQKSKLQLKVLGQKKSGN